MHKTTLNPLSLAMLSHWVEPWSCQDTGMVLHGHQGFGTTRHPSAALLADVHWPQEGTANRNRTCLNSFPKQSPCSANTWGPKCMQFIACFDCQICHVWKQIIKSCCYCFSTVRVLSCKIVVQEAKSKMNLHELLRSTDVQFVFRFLLGGKEGKPALLKQKQSWDKATWPMRSNEAILIRSYSSDFICSSVNWCITLLHGCKTLQNNAGYVLFSLLRLFSRRQGCLPGWSEEQFQGIIRHTIPC